MTDKTRAYAEGIEFTAEIPEEFAGILTPEAVAFVAKLSREDRGRVEEILAKRGELLDGRLRGRQLPDLAQHVGEPAQYERGDRTHHRLRRPKDGQALRAGRRRGRDPGEATRMAPLREAHAR